MPSDGTNGWHEHKRLVEFRLEAAEARLAQNEERCRAMELTHATAKGRNSAYGAMGGLAIAALAAALRAMGLPV